MKTVAIIQARLNSTRLPGKVLLPILEPTRDGAVAAIPIFGSVYRRLREVFEKRDIVFAIPEERPLQQAIMGWVEAMGGREAHVVMVPNERDVVTRYIVAATSVGADAIVRITADCPLIEPSIIRQALELFSLRHSLVTTPQTVDGSDVEIFTYDELVQWDHALPIQDPLREHVTAYAKQRGEATELSCPTWDATMPKLSVDTWEDYQRVYNVSHFLECDNTVDAAVGMAKEQYKI